ncbi:MAG: tetratricopeptide (TPR) repeat protein [Bradymonadia bacterium]
MALEQQSFDDNEMDFFSAQDPQSRADAYADFDPDLQPARAERRVFAFIGAGLVVLLLGIYALMPDVLPDEAASGKANVAAKADKADSPTIRAAASAAQKPAAAKSATPGSATPGLATPGLATPGSATPAKRPSRLAQLLEKNASPLAGAAPSPPDAASATPLHTAARAQIADGEFERALTTLDDGVDGFDTHALRGWALYELGRDANARRDLEAALAIRPDHAESLLLLGSVQQTRDDDAAAKTTYRAFLAAHPDAPQAGEVRQILDRI